MSCRYFLRGRCSRLPALPAVAAREWPSHRAGSCPPWPPSIRSAGRQLSARFGPRLNAHPQFRTTVSARDMTTLRIGCARDFACVIDWPHGLLAVCSCRAARTTAPSAAASAGRTTALPQQRPRHRLRRCAAVSVVLVQVRMCVCRQSRGTGV